MIDPTGVFALICQPPGQARSKRYHRTERDLIGEPWSPLQQRPRDRSVRRKGHNVVEVSRLDGRFNGKFDTLDTENAARAVLVGVCHGNPQDRWWHALRTASAFCPVSLPQRLRGRTSRCFRVRQS